MVGYDNPFRKTARLTVASCCLGIAAVLSGLVCCTTELQRKSEAPPVPSVGKISDVWSAPDVLSIPATPDGDLIRYGRELIEHTAVYLGPKGKVASLSNGMNCQNCHLKGGRKPFGNNYALVASTYPKFRARSGTIESVEKRINDCLERSLNGVQLSDTSRELRAIKAYILWVGHEVPEKSTPTGAGLGELPLLDRAADTVKGKVVFQKHCVLCHGAEGQGRRLGKSKEWFFPPLIGDSSYNIGAGLYRLSRFAAYVKNNMPDGTTFQKPVLTDEEAWDVAAYVNSRPRPGKDLSKDWPDIATKPYDHPFGPYADPFSEDQHKFGPFADIKKASKSKK